METPLIDGRYRLLAELGSGGEAWVYHARDITTDIEVVVRIPSTPVTPVVPEETAPEATPVLHEGWVQLLASGVDAQYGAYQVFELLRGRTLGQSIPFGALDAEAWRLFVDQSLAAVEALHLAGWVHGDLNADNFFETASGWKLLELPFHRLNPLQGRSVMFGSIHTLSPEQIDSRQPDVRSDIYSLGCLYYYAASGTYPHPGATSVDVAIHCLRFPVEPLAEIAPHLPAVWSDGVMHLLAREPDQRPVTIAAARQLLGVAVA